MPVHSALLAVLDETAAPPAGITLVGSDSDTGQNSDTNNFVLTLPTIVADDFGFVYGRSDEAGSVAVLSIAETGWQLVTPLVNDEEGRDKVEGWWWKKFDGTEINVSMTTDVAEERSASVHVWRGVDTVTPFDAAFVPSVAVNDTNPVPPAITTVTDGACIFTTLGLNINEVTTWGAPSVTGLGVATLGETVMGYSRGQALAYILDAGSLGTKTFTAWTNTVTASTADGLAYTFALRPA